MGRRVFLINPQANDVSYLEKALHLNSDDRKRYRLEWDPEEPEVLFVSEVIIYDAAAMDRFRELYAKAGICVFFPGECIAPDLNIFDYAISFSGFDQKDERIVRMPIRLFFSEYLTNRGNNPIKELSEARMLLKKKTGFCNFIYSNPNGHPNRKRIFDTITTYKRVDSYGAFLNNMGLAASGGADLTELVKNSTEIKKEYKFTIACENACFPGYTSEKVLTSLEAGSIPVYWGNPFVSEDVNPDAIINCNEYDSFEAVIERIKEIDSDDDLWCDIISKPWFTEQQISSEIEETRRYYSFLDKLFLQDLSIDRRRPEGTWPEKYQSFWLGRQTGSDKYKLYYELLSSINSALMKGKHLYECIDPAVRTVAIYGMGNIGKILYEDFSQCENHTVSYCIDNRNAKNDLPVECISLAELEKYEKTDLVIVSVPLDFEMIRDSIYTIYDTKVISIVDLIKRF